ncbi:beta-3 adrenergic receptor-like [Spinachia spinachia]
MWNLTDAAAHTRTATTFFVLNCAVLSSAAVLGSPGNLWVCWVVFRTRTLQTSTNALLVSLAVGDLLKCCVDAPLLLSSLVRRGSGGRAAASVCALQRFTCALCGGVQLLTLVGISVERFRAVAFPFRTERRARLRLWIPSIWACGAALALLSLALSEECRPHTDARPRYSDPFGPCVLVPLWGVSLAVIVVHYVRIFKLVRRHRKSVFSRGVRLRPTVSEHVPPSAPGPSGPPSGPAVCRRGPKRAEDRVAQRFGFIIVAFTLFWVPLVVVLLMDAIAPRDTDNWLVELETSAMALTSVQAAVDPLVYTLVTRQFRSELRKILSSVPRCPPKRTA